MPAHPANSNGSPVTATIAKLTGRHAIQGGTTQSKTSTQTVVLRLPTELLAKLDDAVGQRSVRVPRHTWLLEAVAEKLDREASAKPPVRDRNARGRRHGA